jgi:hypothetical protein
MQDVFIAFIITLAMVSFAAIILTWIKHRGPGKRAAGDPEARREVEALSNENAGLKGQVSRLEERLAVLERIATDPAERTAREIERLR